MDPARLVLLAAAGALAGLVNSIAGGGSLISFPALLAVGLSPVAASATNTVAQTPAGVAAAIAYRAELAPRRRLAFALALPGAAGGAVGAIVLLAAPERVFEVVVPWLVALATTLLLLDEIIRRRLERERPASRGRVIAVAIAIALTAVYGGYFGAGIGIVMLALLALLAKMNIHELNAMKSVVVASINGGAALWFVATRAVDAETVVVLALGAVAGGFGGASIARKVAPARVRWVVVAIGFSLSVALALRYYR